MEFSYICSECKNEYPITPSIMVCPDCSKEQKPDEPLRGVIEVELKGAVKEDFTLFDILPVPRRYFPSVPVGNTPLWQPSRLREEMGLPNLFIKDDGLNPTFSFKDRASWLVSAFARQHQVSNITLASTGNAGSSMAGVGAAAGQKVTLFLPETAPQAKLVQALQYGAQVYRVKGNYDFAYKLSLEYSRKKGAMNRNTAYNPMTIEGKKSVAFEIFRQMGGVPDSIFVSVGDGCIVSGIFKGFRDLLKLGVTDKMPYIYGVQSEGSCAIYLAYRAGGKFTPISAQTVADSISVDTPQNGYHAVSQFLAYGGEPITVTDDQIIEAQSKLSSSAGLFSEPAGAAAFAGLLKVCKSLSPESSVVVVNTGCGLKDTTSALKGIKVPERAIDSLDSLPE